MGSHHGFRRWHKYSETKFSFILRCHLEGLLPEGCRSLSLPIIVAMALTIQVRIPNIKVAMKVFGERQTEPTEEFILRFYYKIPTLPHPASDLISSSIHPVSQSSSKDPLCLTVDNLESLSTCPSRPTTPIHSSYLDTFVLP